MEVEVTMSYLGETRTAKLFKRLADDLGYYRWQPMNFEDTGGDATFRYDSLNTTNNATAVYPEWQYKSMLSGFFEVIPVVLGSGTSPQAFSYYTCGDAYGTGQGGGLQNNQWACSMRYFNRATNTTNPGLQQMFYKAFALKKDLGITGIWYQVSGNSIHTMYRDQGGIFMLPIADNR